MAVILGRSDRRAVPVSSEPVVGGEAELQRAVTAGPVERGSLTPRAVVVRVELPGLVQREQVEISDVVTAVEAEMEPGESVGPVEFLGAERVAAVVTPESREVWADVGQSGYGPGDG